MNLDEFRKSLDSSEPPAGLTHALAGLWWDAKGDWASRNESAAIGQVKRLFPVELGECPGLDRLGPQLVSERDTARKVRRPWVKRASIPALQS